MKDLQTIILAGGESKRMGSDKGLVKLDGKPLILRVIEAARGVSNRIVIISSNPDYERFGVPVFEDIIKDKGPAGGIYTGLLNSKYETNVILSCDLPFVEPSLISVLVSRSGNEDVLIYKDQDFNHPLIGVYKKSLTEHFKKCIDKNILTLSEILEPLKVKELDVPEPMKKQVVNVNTKKELDKYS